MDPDDATSCHLCQKQPTRIFFLCPPCRGSQAQHEAKESTMDEVLRATIESFLQSSAHAMEVTVRLVRSSRGMVGRTRGSGYATPSTLTSLPDSALVCTFLRRDDGDGRWHRFSFVLLGSTAIPNHPEKRPRIAHTYRHAKKVHGGTFHFRIVCSASYRIALQCIPRKWVGDHTCTSDSRPCRVICNFAGYTCDFYKVRRETLLHWTATLETSACITPWKTTVQLQPLRCHSSRLVAS
jgi:hypothetical protein